MFQWSLCRVEVLPIVSQTIDLYFYAFYWNVNEIFKFSVVIEQICTYVISLLKIF